MATQPTEVNNNNPYNPGNDPIVGQQTGMESSLSNWAGDYVTDMLGKGWGLTEMPYEAFDGPLIAGSAPLQDQAWAGLGSLVAPGADGDPTYQAQNIGTDLWIDPGVAESYMNPFIQQVLNPQMDEMRRQSEIQRNLDAGRLTQAGAFGGSRQAIMDSERIDNTARLMNETVGQGWRDAYNTGANIFATDEGRELDAARLNMQDRQFETGQEDQSFQNAMRLLQEQQAAGADQRNIAQQGIAADMAQFNEERDYPFKMVQYMQSLLQGLPLEAQSNTYAGPSGLGELMGSAGGIMEFLDILLGGNEE